MRLFTFLNSGDKIYVRLLREILSALARRFAACGIKRSLPIFEFDVVTVNAQGQEIQRERCQAQYFTGV
ncbi:MAG: hypothetical protein AB4426_20970 [Xenococcaceae cyanobacterium]